MKPGTTIAVLNSAPGIVESLGLPDDVAFVRTAKAQLVFLFVRNHSQLEARMPAAVTAMAAGAALWVFFQKGSRNAGLDMNRNSVWSIAEGLGLRPLGLVSVDDTWSVFRLRQS